MAVTSLARSVHRRLEDVQDRVAGRRPAHLLHIGKTGGTAIKDALEPRRRAGRYVLDLHDHSTILADVPEGDRFFFVTRDPITRFVSSFYSRQRKGQPRYLVEWSPGEAAAFERFPTANALAEQIDTSEDAQKAMRAIQHVRSSYWDWFHDEGYLRSRLPDLLLVARQEHLTDDFAALCDRLGLTETLPSDPVKAHKTPADADRSLSDRAVENLRDWYRRDFEFLAMLDDLDVYPTRERRR